MPIKIPAPYVMPWMIRALRHRIPGAIWEVQKDPPSVALTFDDGPGRFTPGLLDVLKKEQVSATFFTVGKRALRQPETVSRAHAEGHLIALHTHAHRSIKKLGENALRQDLALCKENLRDLLGLEKDPSDWYFRPPHGSCNQEMLGVLDSEKVRTVMFSIVPGEQLMPRGWRELPERTCRRILRDVQPGAIIALHDGEFVEETDNIFDCPHIAETAEILIHKLKALGYGFVRLDSI